MTPVPSNSLLRDPLTNPNNLIRCNLSELRNYISEFEFINRAVQQIPNSEDLLSLNVIEALKNFNHRIADNKIVDPLPFISSVKELKILEQQLNDCDEFLGILWAALPISDKPELEDITEIKEWFENPQNQSALDSVTTLDLKDSKFARISREFFKLNNLESLKISTDKAHMISISII